MSAYYCVATAIQISEREHMSWTNIDIANKTKGGEVYQSDHRKWVCGERLPKRSASPFPSVESVLDDIDKCFDVRSSLGESHS